MRVCLGFERICFVSKMSKQKTFSVVNNKFQLPCYCVSLFGLFDIAKPNAILAITFGTIVYKICQFFAFEALCLKVICAFLIDQVLLIIDTDFKLNLIAHQKYFIRALGTNKN